jgi:hypothetical protein
VRRCIGKAVDGTVCTTFTGAGCAGGYCNRGDRTDAGVRTCGTIADGLPCGAATDCGASSWCAGLLQMGPNVTPGLCAPRLASGAACTPQRLDVSDGCPANHLCLDGLCKERLGTQTAGQQCLSSQADCAMGTFCQTPADGGVPTCAAQFAVGTPCTQQQECALGARCVLNVCVALSTVGGPCITSNGCKDTLTCPAVDAGTGTFACVAIGSPGTMCTSGAPFCGSGIDNGNNGFCAVDAGAVCAAPLMAGTGCSSSTQCASGECRLPDAGPLTATNPQGTCAASCIP